MGAGHSTRILGIRRLVYPCEYISEREMLTVVPLEGVSNDVECSYSLRDEWQNV